MPISYPTRLCAQIWEVPQAVDYHSRPSSSYPTDKEMENLGKRTNLVTRAKMVANYLLLIIDHWIFYILTKSKKVNTPDISIMATRLDRNKPKRRQIYVNETTNLFKNSNKAKTVMSDKK